MTENKRRFTRIKIERPVTLSLSDGSVFYSDKIEDLSIGGCLLSATAPLPTGKTCKVEILLGEKENTQTITMKGTTVRSHANVAAVKFDSIDPDSLFLLQNLIRYNSEKPETIEEEIINRPGII